MSKRKMPSIIIPPAPPTKEKTKVGNFKVSGHLQDQKLKYNHPNDNKPSLFDSLKEDTIRDIEVTGIERSEIIEGIRLTPSETKIIDCLCKILHHNSQTLDPKRKDFYTGNSDFQLVDYSGIKSGIEDKEITKAPAISLTLYQLTKEYKGGEAISGKDVRNVKAIIEALNEKKFYIRYTEKTKGKNGKWILKEYEEYRKIIELDEATLSYGEGNITHFKKSETRIVLHPIFRRQIYSKFILYPNDILQQTRIAYGSNNVSEAALKLRDYLMREFSTLKKRGYKPSEIGVTKLKYLVAEKWMKERRKSMVTKYLDKAIQTVTDLGLLESYEIVAGATGEPKVIFTLNKGWNQV